MSPKTHSENPYLAARQEWNERYGDLVAAVRTWRLAALLALSVCLVLAAGSIYLASQATLVPYVVELDRAGLPAHVALAGQGLSADQEARVIRAQLARFVRDVREVGTDVELQKRAIARAYSHLSRQHPAFQAISQFHKEHSPFRNDETVLVDIFQVLPLSADSWRVEWQETSYSRSGKARAPTRMVGIATIQLGGEVREESLLLNPLGLYVLDFNWSRDLIGGADE